MVSFEHVARLTDDLNVSFLEYYGLLPIALNDDGRIQVATWLEDVNTTALDEIALIFNAVPELILQPEAEVRAAIHRVYGQDALSAEQLIAGLETDSIELADEEAALDDLRSMANEAPVVRLVNRLILEALEARASDVHLECEQNGLAVRYRIDGVLQDAASPPAPLSAAIISRIKIMSDLDISERRLPQDGRIRVRLKDRNIDVRVSTLPTLHGESVVLRLLDQGTRRTALDELGMAADTLEQFKDAIGQPNGIVLVTGPTGSGKTTTLYAAVEALRTGREKILTVEDPVEYQLPGISQVPVNPKIGLTFAAALRALLRQDPDVLLVGEIRDAETASIATHAAMTGHLVLATLHTNDAPGALIRLVELGIPNYLVASTVTAVLAQRLVRHVCRSCTHQIQATPHQLQLLGVKGQLGHYAQGRGCSECRGTGFRGRTGIYELLLTDGRLRICLAGRPDASELRAVALSAGMRELRADGFRQVSNLVTTPDEVLRVTTR